MSYPKNTLIDPFRESFSQKYLWCFLVVGNLKSEVRTGMGIYKENTTTWYTYDAGDKLVKTDVSGGANPKTTAYTYDRAGNGSIYLHL